MLLHNDLIPTLQLADRISGKVFVWSATDAKRVAVYPRTEPGTLPVAEAFMESPEINPVTGMPSLIGLISAIRAYLMNAVFRVG